MPLAAQSRQHAEIFVTRGAWTLRDLDSRNGTFIGERQIRGDYSLLAGDVVRIAQCHLAFVQDLTQAFPDPTTGAPGIAQLPLGEETVSGALASDTGEIEEPSDVLDEAHEPTMITHPYVRPCADPAANVSLYFLKKIGG